MNIRELPESPGHGTICRTPHGALWVRTGHDKDYPWFPVHTRTESASDEYVRKQGWEIAWSPDAPIEPEHAHRLVIECEHCSGDGFEPMTGKWRESHACRVCGGDGEVASSAMDEDEDI